MGDKTGIEWTDATWNPTTGCDKVSAGCDHCYAMTVAKRMKGLGVEAYQNDGNPATSGPGFAFTMHPDRLDQPLRWTRPRRIFVNSMSDLFHPSMDREFLAQVFAVMALAHEHQFQVLTKRPGAMKSILSASPHGPRDSFVQRVKHHMWMIAGDGSKAGLAGWHHRCDQKDAWWPLDNVWLGTSVEDQKSADLRIPHLLATPAAIRFLSMEPLLGPVDLDQPRCQYHDRNEVTTDADGVEWCGACVGDGSTGELSYGHWLDPLNGGINWVIAGGESGKGARPMHPDWARSLRDQCAAADVAFLYKQWGEWVPTGRTGVGVLTDPREGYVGDPDADGFRVVMRRVGKKQAGRVLDGVTHDGYPAEVHA